MLPCSAAGLPQASTLETLSSQRLPLASLPLCSSCMALTWQQTLWVPSWCPCPTLWPQRPCRPALQPPGKSQAAAELLLLMLNPPASCIRQRTSYRSSGQQRWTACGSCWCGQACASPQTCPCCKRCWRALLKRGPSR